MNGGVVSSRTLKLLALYVKEIDPLGADSIISKLPTMNSCEDVNGIISCICSLIPNLEQVENYTHHEALAVVRDLGLLAGSIKRHGKEPVVEVPILEPILIKLGQKTNMVPRDTVMHYCFWNPEGERKRRYTNLIEETWLLASTRIAIPKLVEAIYNLEDLYTISLHSTDFVLKCQECEQNLNGMVEAIVSTIKKVPRQVFASELRLYFEPIMIEGKKFLGPAAAELPLFLFDHLLWSSDCQEETYLNYKQNFLSYILPDLLKLHAEYENKPPLLARVVQELRTAPSEYKTVLIEAANALMRIFRILIKFRKPHIKVADEAYASERCIKKKGSGGYDLYTLNYLSDLTSKAMTKLSNEINLQQTSNCCISVMR
jgi:hypothetical protein